MGSHAGYIYILKSMMFFEKPHVLQQECEELASCYHLQFSDDLKTVMCSPNNVQVLYEDILATRTGDKEQLKKETGLGYTCNAPLGCSTQQF